MADDEKEVTDNIVHFALNILSNRNQYFLRLDRTICGLVLDCQPFHHLYFSSFDHWIEWSMGLLSERI